MTTGLVFECGFRRAVVHGNTVSIYRLTPKKKAEKPLWKDTLETQTKAINAAKKYAFEGKINAFLKAVKQ